ncbi:hypothetical protein HpKG129_11450 [Helicobacter pylori]
MSMQMDRISFNILIRYLKKAFLRPNREFTDTIKHYFILIIRIKNEKNWFELVFGF